MADIADQQNIPPTLQAIRARLDLTQEQLAERLGVSFATVNRWEGGVTMPAKGGTDGYRRPCCRGGHRRRLSQLWTRWSLRPV